MEIVLRGDKMDTITKIGRIEAIALVCIIMTNQVILNMPKNIIETCGSSSWINVIFLGILVLLLSLCISKLFHPFMGKDLLDISEYLGGKLLKLIIGIAYIALFLIISGSLLRYFSGTLKIIYYKNTPTFILLIIFLIGAVVANRTGMSSIIKINLVIVPVLIVSIIILFLSTSKLFIAERIFPILGYGINETFLSGLSNLFAFDGIAFVYFIMPLLKNYGDFKKVTIISILISSLFLLFSVLSLLLVFPLLSNTTETLSLYSLARMVEYGRFFQRIDAFFVFLWIFSVFSYLSITLAFILHIFKKIFHIKNSKAMSSCFATAVFAISLISSNIAGTRDIQQHVYKYYELILVFGISIIILLLANWKIKRKKQLII